MVVARAGAGLSSSTISRAGCGGAFSTSQCRRSSVALPQLPGSIKCRVHRMARQAIWRYACSGDRTLAQARHAPSSSGFGARKLAFSYEPLVRDRQLDGDGQPGEAAVDPRPVRPSLEIRNVVDSDVRPETGGDRRASAPVVHRRGSGSPHRRAANRCQTGSTCSPPSQLRVAERGGESGRSYR